MGKIWGGLLLVSAMLVFLLPAPAQAMQVFLNNDIFEVNSDIVFRVVSDVVQNVTVSVNADNATSDQIDSFQINITETGPTHLTRSQSFPTGDYKATYTQGSSSATVYFKIVSEILFPDCKLMGSAEPVVIETTNAIDGGSDVGGNFTDILGLNLSQYVYYGNYTNLTGDGKDYHFVVVDEKAAGVYDTVYIDDDKKFQLFNDSEDNASTPFLETDEGLEGMVEIDSTHRYIIADMDTVSGQKVFLIVPRNTSAFTSSDTLHMLDLLTYENDTVIENKTINITIYDEDDAQVNTNLVDIGDNGFANVSINLSGYGSGKYTIFANDTPVDVFKVESFKLHARITDLSDNQLASFSPGSKAKVWAVSRDVNGDLTDLDASPSGTILLPDGTTAALTFTKQSTGVYTAESSTLTTNGEYKVTVSGDIGPDSESFDTGFSVQSIIMEMMTLNAKYLDEGPGEGTMVNAFAPNSNVSAAVLILNASKGSGFRSGGAPCGSDGTSCIQTPCTNAQFDVVVKDNKGNKYELGDGNFSAMTIDSAASLMGVDGPPEPGMGEQCMLMIWENNTWMSKSGKYKLEVGFSNSSIGDLKGGSSFSVQRLLAMGSTVDLRGDSFSFFAPNSTVRVKLEIRDMVTDELLNGSDIRSAKITEMRREWPSRKNALTEMDFNKTQLNESLSGDKIIFTAPPEEGFYVANFRFKANVSGTFTDGTGMIFFELKKYMVWADLESAGEDNWYVKAGENIILTVTIMDIDQGSRYGKEGATASCTGCEGLVANISSLRNEQFFKEMTHGVDYTVASAGVVANSTSGATINITPSGSGGTDLPSGWYGIDVILSDPDTGESFYGWGWFEIRNFWVDVFEVQLINEGEGAGNYTMAGEGMMGPGGTTVPVGGNVLLGVAAFQPPTPMSPPSPLTVSSVSSEGMMNDQVWPPLPVSTSEYNVAELSGTKTMIDPWCEYCPPFAIKIINVSVSDTIEESGYMLSLRVTASGMGSDVGSAFITVSSYRVDYESVPVSKMYDWPPVYATTENVSLQFNATDFDDNQYNITNVTIKDVFSEKVGRPIKFKHGNNYTNDCTGNTSVCTMDMYLSGLSTGMYFAMFEVTDENGAEQMVEYEFEIKNLLFAVPQIYEGWSWDSSSPDKELDARYGEDSCDSEIWLMSEKYPRWLETDPNSTVITFNNGSEINITLAEYKNHGLVYNVGAFCIEKSTAYWRQTNKPHTCTGSGNTLVYAVNNGTNVWINASLNMANTNNLTENSNFVLAGFPSMNWTIQDLRPNSPGYIHLKLAGSAICGRNDTGGATSPIVIVAPAAAVNFSSFYHGPNFMAGHINEGSNYIKQEMEIPDKPAYIYHNTTHLWIHKGITNVNLTNASAIGNSPYAVGATVSDGYGGLWTLVSLSKSRVTLRGQNALENGILVNTSFSSSGTIKIGILNEQEMGFENKLSNEKGGMDLDGDGLKNGTLYFAILDQGNGYDTLVFSDSTQKWNFTNTSRMVNTSETNRALRQVGVNATLTLLSIDPRANSVRFYDPSAIGEWAELGDARIGENITIPVVVKSPNGSSVTANVSIPTLKLKTTTGAGFVTTGLPAVEISGLGEITINVSSLGLASGRYEFEIKAESDTFGTEYLNEWMWPNSVVRNFMVDITAGYGGVITDFVAVSATKYGGGGSQGKFIELQTINGTDGPCNLTEQGFAARVRNDIPNPWSDPQCTDWEEPTGILKGTNFTYIVEEFDNQYFVYFNENVSYGNQTIWVSKGNCNFSNGNATIHNISEQVNITLGSNLFMFYVQNITHCKGNGNSPYIFIGPAGIDSSTIEPAHLDDWDGNRAPRWFLTTINSTGTIYDVIFANDSSLTYPQAATWGVDSPVKAVWMSSDGNFSSGSNANKLRIGDNFTANEYVASFGPDPWSGILIADSSNLTSLLGAGVRPGMDLRIADMQAYFGKINESEAGLDLDLNMDGDKTDVFYSVAFDDFNDGTKQLLKIYTDDDLNITEPWWADSNNPQNEPNPTYYDFYGDESGSMPEREGHPPTGMWGGNIGFGPENDSLDWSEMPDWNIKTYNGTNMILEKNTWNLNRTKTISITLKVFDFSQNPIQGANVTLTSLQRFGGGQPFATLNASDDADFNLTNTQNTTDSNGYGMIKLTPPPGGWLDNSEYIASIAVTYGGMTENLREWFRMGGNYK